MVSYIRRVVRLCYFHRFTGNTQIRAAEATRCNLHYFIGGLQGTRSRGGAEKSFALLLRKITAPQVVSPNIESDF